MGHVSTPPAANVGVGNSPNSPLEWQAGAWYDVLSSYAGVRSSGAYATGTLIATPLWVPVTRAVDRIAVGVSAASVAGRKCRMGIYANNGGVPGALVIDGGEVTIDAVGDRAVTVLQMLIGGLKYWPAITFDGATSTLIRNVPNVNPVGYATLNSTANDAFAVDRAFTYGPLPDPFGAAVIHVGHVPRIGVRAV